MLCIKPEAQELLQAILTHSRQGEPNPKIIAQEFTQYSEHHVAFVLEQIAQLPFPDITQLFTNVD